MTGTLSFPPPDVGGLTIGSRDGTPRDKPEAAQRNEQFLHSRTHRRSVAVATVLAISLFTPAIAQAVTDDPALPQLDASSDASEPRSDIGFRVDESTGGQWSAGDEQNAQAAEAPAAVDSVVVSDVTSTDARVTWTPPSDNGSSITRYHLQLLVDGSVTDELITDEPSTGATVFGLEPDTTYALRVAAINAVGTGPFSSPSAFTTTHSSIERQFGADRFDTAVRVSESAFPFEGVQVTFIANGLNFPDALAAAAAAGSFGGPVLLTRPGSVGQTTINEVAALKPEFLFAAGGSAVVSNSVFNTLAPYATNSAERIAGATRFETAAFVSTLWEGVETVYLANGMNFPDALAGAAAAGFNGAPILLTNSGALPPETLAALDYHRPAKIVVLGGAGAVSQAVVNQARTAAGGSSVVVQRLSGDSRYGTAIEISRQTFTSSRVPVVYVASGQNFADALAGAAAAGALGGPVLLTEPTNISNATIAEIERLDPVRVVVLGGPSVVSPDVYDRIEAAIG